MKKASNDFEAWFAKAEADLRTTELILQSDNSLIEIGCYHAQQCAEKYLKGYLVFHQLPFKFVHELAYLTRLCMNHDSAFRELLDAASTLQDYATSVRYPSEGLEPLSITDAQESLECAQLIRKFVLEKVS
jgi:HEPN domain-containing protein